MRNWIIGAAAVMAVSVPGVAAAQQATGYVGAVYGNVDVDGFDEETFYGAEGALAINGAGPLTFEIDASVLDGEDSDTGYGLLAHLYARNDNHLFGGFVGLSDSGSSDTSWLAGLEASKFFQSWTFAGAIAYGSNDDTNTDGWGANVEGRFFVHENFRLQGNVAWASLDTPGLDNDGYSYGVGGEYQFSAIPVSVTAGYARTEFNDANFESDAVTIGLRYNWGGSLRDRDRNGASQAGIVGGALSF